MTHHLSVGCDMCGDFHWLPPPPPVALSSCLHSNPVRSPLSLLILINISHISGPGASRSSDADDDGWGEDVERWYPWGRSGILESQVRDMVCVKFRRFYIGLRDRKKRNRKKWPFVCCSSNYCELLIKTSQEKIFIVGYYEILWNI